MTEGEEDAPRDDGEQAGERQLDVCTVEEESLVEAFEAGWKIRELFFISASYR